MKDESGAAYPIQMKVIGNVVAQDGQQGMTLLEYYAGQALAGILAANITIPGTEVIQAFNYAETMIAERNRRNGN